MSTRRTVQANEAILIAERRVLNAVFNDPALLDRPELSKDLMLHGNCKSMYAAIDRLRSSGAVVSRDSLLQEASDRDINVSRDEVDFITSSTQQVSFEDIKDAIDALNEGAKRLAAIGKLNDAVSKINESPLGETIDEAKQIIEEAEASLALTTDNVKTVHTFDTAFVKYDEELARRRRGKPYPFRNFIFDELLVDGAMPGTFGCLSASSGSGKSTIAMSLLNSLIEWDLPVMMFSLEMALTPTIDRLISKRTQIPYTDLVLPKDDTEFDAAMQRIEAEKAELLTKKNFRVCEDANLSLSDIKKHVKKFQTEIGQQYCIVIIDLLSMVSDFKKVQGGANFSQSAEIAVDNLSALVKELGVHVVGIVQLNRTAEVEKANSRADLAKFKPSRSSVKNANAYLERSRYLLTAYREKFWAEQCLEPEEYEDMEDIITVTVAKQNNGPIKSVNALFDGSCFDIIAIDNSLASGATP